MIRVLVWNEFYHEKVADSIWQSNYPDGIHKCIADFLGAEDDIEVRCATLDDENCGITKEILDNTDVIIWWGHMRHGLVPDEVAYMVRDAVLAGMGAIFLHSAHYSKPFKYLLGTGCHLTWRDGDRERLWVVEPSHPITRGIDRVITLEEEEMYGEPFAIPTPDKLLFISNFSGGEVFRSGCLWERGNGKIFYFRPGDENYKTYYNPQIQTVIKNAVRFVNPDYRVEPTCPHVRNIDSPEGYVI